MTINWEISPEPTEPSVPRRPVSSRNTTRQWRQLRRPGRGSILIAGALAVLLALGSIALLPGGSTPSHRAAVGSKVGQQDPFDIRRPQNLLHEWSVDFVADPTEMLVDQDDAFVVTPTQVTALGTDEGRLRWKTDVKDAEPFVAADASTVFVAAGDGFEALDRRTGTSRWRAEIDDPTDIGRSVGLVHVKGAEIAVATTEQGGIVGFDGTTGAVRWSVAVDGSPRGRVAADEATGSVAVLAADGEHVALRVLDAATGAVRWSRSLERDTSVPVVVGDLLIVGTSTGEDHAAVMGLSVADGSLRWQVATTEGFEATTGPAVHGSTVVFVDKLGTVYAIRAGSGRLRWRSEVPGPVLADSPAIAAGVVVVHDSFAQVHTVDLATGKLLASRESIGVPLGLAGTADRVVYAQTGVQYGQVMAYAPAVLAQRVGHPAPTKSPA